MRWMFATVLACAALAACSGPDPSPPAPVVSTGPSAVATMTDCGTFDLPQGDKLPASAAACLVDAVRAGTAARLAVTRPTTEGDPIPVTYTAGSDGRVQVVTDSRQDGYGPRVITRQTCTGPTAAPELDFAQCSDPTPVTR